MARHRKQKPVACTPAAGMLLRHDPAGDPQNPWIVQGPHRFSDGTFTVTIPSGFRSDLASVPLWLLWLISPFGNHQRAALFHDFCYRKQPMGRFAADAVFRVVMERDGVPCWKTWLLFYAVRCFGWFAWSQNRLALQKEVSDD